jgi:hypothetical protein
VRCPRLRLCAASTPVSPRCDAPRSGSRWPHASLGEATPYRPANRYRRHVGNARGMFLETARRLSTGVLEAAGCPTSRSTHSRRRCRRPPRKLRRNGAVGADGVGNAIG